jgi:hypothetical protein
VASDVKRVLSRRRDLEAVELIASIAEPNDVAPRLIHDTVRVPQVGVVSADGLNQLFSLGFGMGFPE